MDEKLINDIYYVCSLIEYTARKTKNHRGDITRKMSLNGLRRQLRIAGINHCLSFEQVSDELIEDYEIQLGDFDTVAECKYNVPSYLSIGKLYQRLVVTLCLEGTKPEQAIADVFESFISDEISDFNSSVYYRSPDYIRYSYLEGQLLA